ncbi:hydrolase [Tersicoccus solisilvae]|uniref:Hydrolase n=1 Tax=Tersicoccus solisilvae TaxID=1882339 RepID=A0ABQ1P8F1_9MICC|nr:Ppx/GppA phosphatase family protein [Tersicoccus solisilvae]GGC92940.1 hydrolase [Tersicoccus solisilvae]
MSDASRTEPSTDPAGPAAGTPAPGARRVAAIDCGTNSIRLLIADVSADGTALTDVVRTMRVVRLGQGVDRTGRLAEQALDRTFAACRDYAAQCREHDVTAVRFVATSATRDAQNRQDFVDGVRDILGVEPEVISGDEEAALSFAGALSVLDPARPLPALVVDLGGGSTEFVLGDRDGVRASLSTDVGCVRMTERHLNEDPPTEAQIAAATADIDAAIDAAAAVVPLEDTATVIGVAGTITTVTAHALGLGEYDAGAIHGAELDVATLRASADALLHATRAERAAMPFMHPGRVDVIGAGALIWSQILERVAATTGSGTAPVRTAVTSEHDILDGIALSVPAGTDGPSPRA